MKKGLTLGLVLVVMVWTMGLSAFVPVASAATLSAGDLIKASGPAVYYYAADGKRYTFPTLSTYSSWYADFSGVKTITDGELSAIDLAGNIVVRPGTKLVKISTVPKVFAVEPNGKLVWVKTEAAAKALYGDNWNQKITIIPDGFWSNYTDTGKQLDGTAYPAGTLVKQAASADVYYVNTDGTWSKVTEAGVTANKWNLANVVTAAAGMTMSAGTAVSTAMYTDASQGGGAGSSTVTPPVATGTGTLTVALAADTPVAGPVADNATANFTKFSLTATGAAVSVTKVFVTKGGFSSTTDFENIKITDLSGIALTNTASLNSDGTAALTFNPAQVVAAGSTVSYYIKAGVENGTTAGKTASFAVYASKDVTSTAASVAGAFPVQGNAMNILSVDIGSATISSDGSITDSTPDAGETNVSVNQFRVEAGTTEAITIESLSLLETGTASLTDISNIELWSLTENKTLGTVASWSADGKANFTNLNLVVNKGDIYRFKVMVDILSGAGLTSNADLTDGSDVLMSVKGNSFGFYITPSVSGGWNGRGGADQTINSGSLTVSKSATTPATGNITEAPDQLLAVWDMEAKGEEVRVSALTVTITNGGNGDGDELISCKLYDAAGSLVAGPVDGVAADTISFTDTFTVPVGVHKYSLKCRVYDADADDWTGGTPTWRVGFTPSTAITAKGVSTNDTITAAPATAVNGNVMTLSAATLTAKSLTYPGAQNVSKSTADFIWSVFSLDAANSGENINVTAVVIEDTIAGTGTGSFADIDNVEIWCDLNSTASTRGDAYETRVSSTETPTASTQSFTFTQTVTITKNAYVRCAVVGDLASAATTDDTHSVSLDTDSGDVTATGASTGTAVSVTPTGDGQAMTVKGSGDVTLTVDSTSPKAAIFVESEKAQTVAVFRVAASDVEDLDLDSLLLTDDGSDDTVEMYYIYSSKRADGGSTSSPIASVSGGATGQVYFADGTVSVPADGYVLLTVKADFVAKSDSVANGSTLEVTVDGTGSDDLQTTGLSSGLAVDSDDSAIDAATHEFYQVRPVVTKDSSSPSGSLGTGPSTLVAVFRVSNADGTQDLFFDTDNQIIFQITGYASGTSVASGNVVFKDKAGNILETVASQDLNGTSGVVALETTLAFATNNLTVSKGEYELISVYADTRDYTTAGNSMQVSLDDTDGDFEFSIGTVATTYNVGDIVFRGDIQANTLGK